MNEKFNYNDLFPSLSLTEKTRNNIKESEKRTKEFPLETKKTLELRQNEKTNSE